jgi:two-component system, cell cycle response regulator
MDTPKILLVDDRRENILVLEAVLEKPGLDIFFATSGNEALSLLLEHEFALILLDVQMPGMDGFETAELIRSREKTMHTPIIFVSAINKEERYVFAGYEKGAVDYLSKPIDETILRSKVNVFVDLYTQKKTVEKAYGELQVALDELERSNKMIMENQRAVIEEERLKLLLQVSGATVQEMTDPLNSILQGLDSLKSHAAQCKEHCFDAMEDLERIGNAGILLQGVISRIQEIPAMQSGLAPKDGPLQADQTVIVLCVDDDEGYFHLISAMLAGFPHIRMTYAGSCADAEELLSGDERADLILLDHFLPDGDSFRILSFLKQREMDVPSVIITGRGDEVVAARAIKLGAVDYLPKNEVHGERLFESIQAALEQRRMKQDLRKAMTVVADMATRDSLTVLYNRRYFFDSLEKEIAREERYRTGLSLCMIDIDFFKSINDTYGHLAGDRVLKELADMMRETVRENDIVCRYGGEEFSIIFPHTRIDKAYGICERFRRIVEDHVFSYEHFLIRATVSIGLTGFSPGDGVLTAHVIERADRELYRAKEEGRNRVCAIGAGRLADSGALPEGDEEKARRVKPPGFGTN